MKISKKLMALALSGVIGINTIGADADAASWKPFDNKWVDEMDDWGVINNEETCFADGIYVKNRDKIKKGTNLYVAMNIHRSVKVVSTTIWSSNPKVIKISDKKKGIFTALKKGKAVIKYKVKYKNTKRTFKADGETFKAPASGTAEYKEEITVK